MSPRIFLFISLAVIAFGAGFVVSQLSGPATPVEATVFSKPRPLPPFELVDQHEAHFTRDSLEGHWSLLFFGFTNCPDVCPMALNTLKSVTALLDDLPAPIKPQVVFVTVDPTRDTPDVMRRYVGHFSEDFMGVTGSLAAMAELLRALGVATSFVRLDDSSDYTVDHSAGIYLINPHADEHAVFTPPHLPGDIARDYRTLAGGWQGK